MTEDAVRDECRREVAARGLTPAAVTHLTNDALGRINFSVLAPVKGLLKRFFSDGPWSADDDRALAELVGPGEGWWHYELATDIDFEFGWRAGGFRLEVAGTPTSTVVPDRAELLADTFDELVTPEATPNPRTIRFVTGPIHDGPSLWYESAAGVDDPRVARLFADFADVDNVLVGPDFVAVGLRRPDRWEALLAPVLRVVAAEFAGSGTDAVVESGPEAPAGKRAARPARSTPGRDTGIERAWRELGSVTPDQPDGLERVRAALASPDVADRQVAARVLVWAEPRVASAAWERLLADPSRAVRRAAVDAMVDAERPALRPLLERALGDADAWIRWKGLSGLVGLGIDPSRAAVGPLTTDADFRVRLEATAALRDARGTGSP